MDGSVTAGGAGLLGLEKRWEMGNGGPKFRLLDSNGKALPC